MASQTVAGQWPPEPPAVVTAPPSTRPFGVPTALLPVSTPHTLATARYSTVPLSARPHKVPTASLRTATTSPTSTTKRIVRTDFPSWAESPPAWRRMKKSRNPRVQGRQPPTKPHPSRVVSDVPLPSTERSPSVTSQSNAPAALATSLQIQAAQKEWELKQRQATVQGLLTASGSEYGSGDSSFEDSSASSDDDDSTLRREQGHQAAAAARRASTLTKQPQRPDQLPIWRVERSLLPAPPGQTMPIASSLGFTTHQLPLSRSLPSAVQSGGERKRSHSQISASPNVTATETAVRPASSLTQKEIHGPGPHYTAPSTRSNPGATREKSDEGGPKADLPSPSRRYLNPNELEAKLRQETQRGSGMEHDEHDTVAAPEVLDSSIPYREILTTEHGRPYNVLHTHNGTLKAPYAAFPTNYELHTDQSFPFICPIRDCRRMYSNLKALYGHVAAAHNKTKFNDNLDGTMTAVGRYFNDYGLSSPAIIVSRSPLKPDAPPPAKPSLSNWTTVSLKRLEKEGYEAPTPTPTPSIVDPSPATVRSPVPLPSYTNGVQAPLDARTYLRGLLSPGQEVPDRADCQELLQHRPVRSLPRLWIDYHRKTLLDTSHYACALAYLVGEEVVNAAEKCKGTTWSTSRLSDHCIRLPSSLSSAAKRAFSRVTTCIGCRYYTHLQRRTNKCTFMLLGEDVGTSEEPSATDYSTDALDLEDQSTSAMDLDTAPRVPVHVPDRTLRQRPRLATRKSGLSRSVTYTSGDMSDAKTQLEMEDWEFAPGRLTTDATPAMNLAFSNSYLRSGEPITVADDISFNVILLHAGDTHRFGVEDAKLRTCSVADGKVKVTLAGKDFKVGPHGMFKVLPGQSCTVENRLYVAAYIHCTTINDYRLAA